MKVAAFTLALLLSAASHAQTKDSSSIPDSVATGLKVLIENFKQESHSPGIAIVIVHENDVVFSHASGYTDNEKQIPSTIHAKYPVMSVTKLFTATMLMQLAEKGIVNIHDPVSKYVPEYKVQSDYEGYAPTTLWQLATHTSGLPRDPLPQIAFSKTIDKWMSGEKGVSAFRLPDDSQVLHSLYYTRLAYSPLDFIHHNDRHYSNLGYSVLGIALQRAVMMDYARYVLHNICKPLKMHSTGFSNEFGSNRDIATGYRYDVVSNSLLRVPAIEINYARYAGGMYSTASDLAKFISTQFEDSSSAKILSPQSLSMMRMQKIGWKAAFPYVLHEGALPGYRSIIVYNPQNKTGWVILMNVQDADFNSINERLAAITRKVFVKKSELPVEMYAGTYSLGSNYGKIKITARGGKLYSDYLPELSNGQPLIHQGENRFSSPAKAGHTIHYEFVPVKDGTINLLKMGQYSWYRE